MTEKEREFCSVMFDEMSGSFINALYKTIMRADVENLVKFTIAFPEEVSIYLQYCNEPSYWYELKQEYERQRLLLED